MRSRRSIKAHDDGKDLAAAAAMPSPSAFSRSAFNDALLLNDAAASASLGKLSAAARSSSSSPSSSLKISGRLSLSFSKFDLGGKLSRMGSSR